MGLSLLLIASSVNALQLPTPARVPAADAISRRAFGAQTAAGLAALALGSQPVLAAKQEEASRMGGLCVPAVRPNCQALHMPRGRRR